MQTLVPLDTATANLPSSTPAGPAGGPFTLSQQLAPGVSTATFNLASYGFQTPPSQILANLVRSDGTKSGLTVFPRQWTATSWTADLSANTPDGTYVLSITIYP